MANTSGEIDEDINSVGGWLMYLQWRKTEIPCSWVVWRMLGTITYPHRFDICKNQLGVDRKNRNERLGGVLLKFAQTTRCVQIECYLMLPTLKQKIREIF
jgi:hypothetical protein